MKRKGLLFIISAPSGAGKTSLFKKVIERVEDIKVSVSHTNRSPRLNERDGVDYHFIKKEEFQEKIKRGEFIEWAEVHGNLYGTSIENLKIREDGVDVPARSCLLGGEEDNRLDLILVIDIQGAEKIRKVYKDAISIFILPPTIGILEDRLKERGADSEEEIQRRLNRAKEEISYYKDYDYVITNDDIDKAAEELRSIIIAERCRVCNLE
ncbi:MAG: guanylate kinase [Nitrospinae bacterium]|nr:guanylate kinase [Nitrospinota bacterium]